MAKQKVDYFDDITSLDSEVEVISDSEETELDVQEIDNSESADVANAIEDLINKYGGEKLVEEMAKKGIKASDFYDAKVKQDAIAQQAKAKSPKLIIKNKGELYPEHFFSRKCVYSCVNKRINTYSEMNGADYLAEQKNPDYLFTFKQYETTEYDWEVHGV